MTSQVGRHALLLLRAATASALTLACTASPGGGDAGEPLGVDAGPDGVGAAPLPCERTTGVCAGAVRALLADGGFEPVCTGASYGARYEAVETRCDGVDNDCDGETDRHWAVLHPRSPFSTWSVPAARLDAGYLVLAHELDGGVALRRFDDQLKPLGSAEALQLSDAGYLASERLLLTRQGATLVYVQTPDFQAPVSAFFAPLSEEGVRLRDAQGGPQLSQVGAEPLPGWGLRAAASLDGTRVMLAFHAAASDASSPEPQELLGVVTDALGNVLTGPTRLMRVEADGQARTLYQQSVVGESNGFVLVASESVVGTQAQTLRLQRYASTLEPVGDERRIEVNLDPDAHLARLAGSGEVALAYRELATDGGYQLRVARNLFDGGVAETWAEGVQESAWISFQGSSRGLQLAWKAQTLCPECPESGGVASYRGRVFARSESSAVVELTPGTGALQFDGWSRPGVALTPGPEGWMTFFVPVLGDAGVDLRAVRYCAP